MTYHFLIRGRNCEKYLKECVDSINAQVGDFEKNIHVFLDDPQDDSAEICGKLKKDSKIHKLKISSQHLGLCANMDNALGDMNMTLEPNDVICIVDADDYLHPKALKYVNREYTKPNTLVTHGSYIKLSKGRRTRISKPYKSWEDIRKVPWRASHLKTLKVKLLRPLGISPAFNTNIFMHEGLYLNAASDLALMMPLCELAGWDRVAFIKKEIYYWRDNTPFKTNGSAQKRCEKIIRAKPKLERWCE